jgi:adenylate cyclase
LGVRYVLEGGVRRSGERVRVTAQLIEAETGNHIWAERYDRNVAEVFALQDEITAAVMAAIIPAVIDAEQRRAMRKPPETLGAWETYQRGLWFSRPSAGHLTLASGFLDQAIKMDPTFVAPHYRLAHLLMQTAVYRMGTVQEAVNLAEPLAQRAIQLDPADADAQAIAVIVSAWRGEWDSGLARAERAVSLNSDSALAHRALGFCLMNFDRPADARGEFLTCLRINSRDPMNWLILLQLGGTYYLERDYRMAAESLEQARMAAPSEPEVHVALAAALGQLGRRSEAQEVLRHTMALVPKDFDPRVPGIVPWRRRRDVEHVLEGLHKAGWHD